MMNRKVVVSLVLAAAFGASSAFAANYGTAGCGLGNLAFKNQKGKIQIVAATVNGISGNQTFGMTSGTSECVEGGAHEEAALYITINEEALRNDISRGNGEALVGLSKIMGCSDVEMLGSEMQKNYGVIFPSDKTDAVNVNRSIDSVIRGNSDLAKTCRIYG